MPYLPEETDSFNQKAVFGRPRAIKESVWTESQRNKTLATLALPLSENFKKANQDPRHPRSHSQGWASFQNEAEASKPGF